ncbi:SLC13 family permease [Blastopirellula marina]|uniref:SLC13 family permease n=1 Tax=Blastopirellula marina TaxID=124 RepID=A0A2S8F5X6_9BACT|nr:MULTISPECIES: SLC13 family permease [Pirellulaceae]PQO27552.1 SLC13 family permease [Blastopirellula marina]RCS48089.1 SLC13 family permease [Bremerella cremea]
MEFLQAAHPWIAIATTLGVFLAIQFARRVPVDLLFLLALCFVTLAGVISPQMAISGFASRAVIAISALLVVSAGLRKTGVLDWIGGKILGRATNERSALLRLTGPIVVSAAFVLNTALVAMMMPVILDWCRQRNLSPSKLLLPLSYLTILGGVCTLIGTSTTLVVNEKLRDSVVIVENEIKDLESKITAAKPDDRPALETRLANRKKILPNVQPMGFFEISWIGIPCALVGSLYMLVLGQRFLPGKRDIMEMLGDQQREYLVEMMVQPDCPLIDRTVEAAGLRNLHGLFLIEIDREGDIITPVTPRDFVRSGDRLVFTGLVNTIVDLEKIPGLIPAADRTYEFHPQSRVQRHLTEVVLSPSSPLIGTTVRKANFRQLYNAAVVAVHRNGQRLPNKIGNIELEVGDTLLLQTRTDFIAQHRNNRDFYLVSSVDDAEPRRHDRALISGGLMILLILWLCLTSVFSGFEFAGGWGSPAIAALTIAGLMILTQCLSASEARGALDMQVIVTIAAALGLGNALWESGAAQMIAEGLVSAVGTNPFVLLVVIYLLTVVFTETITNTAVAALLLPIAVAIAQQSDLSPRPFIMAIAIGASMAFLTPIGYQTNLMVMGPGGYTPRDYLKSGIPLAILIAITSITLIPRIWSF